MAFVGGDITEITYNHSVVGSGTLFCKSAEDGSLEPGGLRSNDDDAGSSGNGIMVDIMNWRRGSFECPPILWDMTGTDEQQKLISMASSPILADWTINSVSGKIWGGKGKPVGDIMGSTNSATIPLKLSFDGKLKPLN